MTDPTNFSMPNNPDMYRFGRIVSHGGPTDPVFSDNANMEDFSTMDPVPDPSIAPNSLGASITRYGRLSVPDSSRNYIPYKRKISTAKVQYPSSLTRKSNTI